MMSGCSEPGGLCSGASATSPGVNGKLLTLELSVAVDAGEEERVPRPGEPPILRLRTVVLHIAVLCLLLALLTVAALPVLHVQVSDQMTPILFIRLYIRESA